MNGDGDPSAPIGHDRGAKLKEGPPSWPSIPRNESRVKLFPLAPGLFPEGDCLSWAILEGHLGTMPSKIILNPRGEGKLTSGLGAQLVSC